MANTMLRTVEEQGEHTIPLTPLTVSPEASETLIASPVAAATITPSTSSVSSTRRYDQATIEQALSLALQMQQEHRATLTAEQVVRLGEEINVDQAFILRALAQVSAADQASTTAAEEATYNSSQSSSRQLTSVTLRALSRTNKVAAVVLPFIYSLFAFFVFHDSLYGLRSNSVFSIALLFVVGPLLAVLTGAGLRSKRLGFWSGALLGFWLIMATWTVASPAPDNEDFFGRLGITFLFTMTGAALGTLAAMTARHGGQFYRRLATALARRFPGLAVTDAGGIG